MANANDYLIPFGIDGTKFFSVLDEMETGAEKVAQAVESTNKDMQKGFDTAAAAGDKLGEKIKNIAAQTVILRDDAKALGKDVAEALSGKNTSTDLEKKLARFTELLAKFSTNANKPIKFNIDAAKLEEFEKLLAAGADELQVLNAVIDATKQSLATLDPNTEEFAALNAQLQIAEGFMEGLNQATEGANKAQTSLKGQLRQIKQALAEMELAGQGGTEEFRRLSLRAGELEDQIGDVSSRVKILASDTKYLDAGVQAIQGLAGAFTAGQGAAALFGEENENVQKVIAKVTGAMAILQGVQAVANALNKDSALSVLLFSKAQGAATVTTTALAGAEVAEAGAAATATTATNAFTAALLENPITAILVAIAALVVALITLSDNTDVAKVATDALNASLEEQDRILQLDTNSIKRRTDVLAAQAKAEGALAASRAKTDADRLRIQQQTSDKVNAIQKNGIRQQLEAEKLALFETQLTLDNKARLELLSAEDIKKVTEKSVQQQEKIKDLESQLRIEDYNAQKDAADRQGELTKKQIEDAKKAAEERKKILEQQIKFTAELEKSRVDGIRDQYDRERAQIAQQLAAKIAELNADKSLSAKAEQDKQKLIQQLQLNAATETAKITNKETADLLALRFKANEMFADLAKEGYARDLENLRLGFDDKRAAVKEQYKDEAELRDQLLQAINASQIRAEKKLSDEAAAKSLQEQQDRAVLEVETAKQFIPDLPGVEEQKQVAILQVKLKYAELSLQQLLDQGNEENSVVVLQAKKAINDLQKELGKAVNDAAKATPAIDWFKMLGMGDLSKEQRDAVVNAAQKALDSVRQISDFIIEQYQRQIDKKQEVIDQIDDDINGLEDQLNKEKDLREKGLANNVDVIQAQLDAKQHEKDEEIKQQEELQKKKQQIAKLQLIADTAAQASNLITAATEIFKTLSSIPFVGIPLAIATIGLMTGAFIATKIKAFQLVNDQKSFGKGGYIDGKPHSHGGKKYYAADGSGVELEGGEYVTNKASTSKYSDLLEAINNDDLRGMDEDGLRNMLQSVGVHLQSNTPSDIIKIVHERNDARQQVLLREAGGADISDDLKSINKNVGYLADKERMRAERWEDDMYFYEKIGSKTTKIKKP